MDEILSSIKRIIQEEGDGPVRGRRVSRAAPPPPAAPEDEEVLELSDPMPPHAEVAGRFGDEAPATVDAADLPDHPEAESAMPQPAAQIRPMPGAAPAEPLLSRETAEASRSALDNLSRMMVKPEPGSDGSLEGLVRDMLRPMLREWLDANLPAMVEKMVEGEIARITGGGR